MGHAFPEGRAVDGGSIQAWVTELLSQSLVKANARTLPFEETFQRLDFRSLNLQSPQSQPFTAFVIIVVATLIFCFVCAVRRRVPFRAARFHKKTDGRV